jgi:hypothetical protein
LSGIPWIEKTPANIAIDFIKEGHKNYRYRYGNYGDTVQVATSYLDFQIMLESINILSREIKQIIIQDTGYDFSLE